VNAKTRIVIVGATSAMAEHCARLWAANTPVEMTLIGRNAEKMERIATDLKVRSPGSDIAVVTADFADPAAIRSVVDTIAARGVIDVALIAHGTLPDQKACEADLALAREAMEVNAISPALWAEAIAGHMARSEHGTLGIIGSVAGDRGRRSNYVYGAAKGLVTRYAQGLQHRFAGKGVKVVLIKPGPTATPMTASLGMKGLAPVEDVAKAIVAGMAKGSPLVYAPVKWWLIMMIIRHLPRFVFNKMNI
jgi:decaprenylphospho-beta-D-erythro-pentofuranosid-2-ulose 2-reductase